MSDETRTVTVDPMLAAKMRLFADMIRDHRSDFRGWAAKIDEWADQVEVLAALPTSTEGLRCDYGCDACRDFENESDEEDRLASLSPSPTETPEPTEEEPT